MFCEQELHFWVNGLITKSSLTPEVTPRVHIVTLEVNNNFPAVTYALFLF